MDYTEFLEDFLPSIDNIPSEIQHVMNELLAKDTELHSLLDNISKLDRSLSKLMRSGPNPAMKHSSVPGDPTDLAIAKEFAYEAVKPVPEQLAIYNEIETLYDTCRDLVSDKIHLSDRIKETLDRHLKKLCSELDRLEADDLPINSNVLIPTIEEPVPYSRLLPDFYSRPAPTDTPTPSVIIKRKHDKLSTPRINPSNKKSVKKRSDVVHTTPSIRGIPNATELIMDEQLYCVCHEISYGQMIACENNECKKEWFHLECVKLKEIPTGMWYCNDCLPQNTTTNLKKIIE